MTKRLYIAWRSGGPTLGRWGPVGRLDHDHDLDRYRFLYTRGAKSLIDFSPFPDMPTLDVVYESNELFPFFANRLLSNSRPEYEEYLKWGGFDLHNNPPDPISLLGVTEGIRQTDSFEVFPHPSPDPDGNYVTRFFLHGIRWISEAAVKRVNDLSSEDRLGLMLDIANEYDPSAVAVRTMDLRDRFMIGYVPRYLAKDVHTLWELCKPDVPELSVNRVNHSAPLQNRLLCQLSTRWPDGFSPCSGDEYQPIVAHFESMPQRV